MNDSIFNPSNLANPVVNSLQGIDSLSGLGSAVKDSINSSVGAALVDQTMILEFSASPVGSIFQAPLATESVAGNTGDISGSDGTVNPFANMSGVFTVGSGGLLSIDVLADNGSYQSQLGVFSLTGMEGFQVGSADFMQEAARRVVNGAGQGYLMFDDAAQGARFNSNLGELDCNLGDYSGAKTVGFKAGEKVALILMPNGNLQDVVDGNATALFSMNVINGGGSQLAKVGTNTFGWEDQNNSSFSDKDYNDLIIKVGGAAGQVAELSQVVNADRNWQQSQFAQQINGSKTVVPYTVSTEIGKWQPTSAVTSPLLPQWGQVTPFALETANQFRPEAPPALDSA